MEKIRSVAEQIIDLRKRLKEMGGPDYDRELLNCRKCGLVEDVTVGGALITVFEKDIKYGADDTMLRFAEVGGGVYECPNCQTKILEPAAKNQL